MGSQEVAVSAPVVQRRPADHSGAQRRELAQFLRIARERVKPDEVGMIAGARRRAPGLLREEVAQLASISCSWYSWLEQGRDIQVSEQVLDAVAGALMLSSAETSHLFRLAGYHPMPCAAEADDAADDRGLRRLMHQMRDAPAYLVDRRWNIIEWNAAATALFEIQLDDVPRCDRNALRFALLGTHSPLRFVDPIAMAHIHIAQFRAETAALIGDPLLERQIRELERDSPLFRRLWPLREVHPRGAAIVRYTHRTLGQLRFDFVSTQVGDDAPVRMHVFLPRAL
jgi:transcriptional regulator with XRE-family HTH domain